MDRNDPDGPLVFAGSASPRLTKEICRAAGVTVGQGEVLRFSEGTLFPRGLENVRGRRVCLVQSTVFPANDDQRSLCITAPSDVIAVGITCSW